MLAMADTDMPRDDELMTLKEAASAYDLSIPTMRQTIRERRMPSWRLGRVLMIRRVDAEAMRERLRILRRNG